MTRQQTSQPRLLRQLGDICEHQYCLEVMTRFQMSRCISYFRAQKRNQENILLQYRQGKLGEHTPWKIGDFACQAVNVSDYSQEDWQITKVGYSDDYVAFVETATGLGDDKD